MRELWGTVLHASGARAYSLLVSVLVLFVTARILGPDGRGQVAAIITWVGLFAILAGLSLGQVAIHRLAQDPGHRRFGELFGSLLLLAGVLALLAWATASVLAWLMGDRLFRGLPAPALLVGFLALPFMLWEQYGSALLAALGHLRIYSAYQVLGRTITLVAVLTLVAGLGWGVLGVLQASLVGEVVVATGGIALLVRHARRNRGSMKPRLAEVRALLAGGARLHLNAIGTFMFTSANLLILNHYRPAAEVGHFQLAAECIAVLMVLPQAASTVVFGEVAQHGPDRAWPRNRRILFQLTALMVFLCLAAMLAAPLVIPLLAGAAFGPAVAPFQWMLLGIPGMALSCLMAPQWIGRGYFWQAAGLTFLVGCCNMALSFWLIPDLGMTGAVISFVTTYAFAAAGNGAMAWHCQAQYDRTQRVAARLDPAAG